MDKTTDRWRNAILVERQKGTTHSVLKRSLEYLDVNLRESALILGDASLIQTRYLLEQGFLKVTDVDSSPSIYDYGIIKEQDSHRVRRILSTFSKYIPRPNSFDLIYGKSIAFNPKNSIEPLLNRLNLSLKKPGIFSATYGSADDTFRRIHYKKDELRDIYTKTNFSILNIETRGPIKVAGLIRPGVAHTISIYAKRI